MLASGRTTEVGPYADYLVRRRPPPDDLRPSLSGFTLLELRPDSPLDPPRPWRLLPDGSAYLLLHVFEDGVRRWSRWRFVGPRSVYGDIDRRRRRHTLIARFLPGTAGRFLTTPIADLVDASADALQLLPEAEGELAVAAEAAESGRWRRCLRSVERALRRARRPETDDSALARLAIRRLEVCGGTLPVGTLEEWSGWSNRYLRGLIRDASGLPPKRLSRIFRLRLALRFADSDPDLKWAEIAARLGFCDQPHLIADFDSLAGETPGRLRNRLHRE